MHYAEQLFLYCHALTPMYNVYTEVSEFRSAFVFPLAAIA